MPDDGGSRSPFGGRRCRAFDGKAARGGQRSARIDFGAYGIAVVNEDQLQGYGVAVCPGGCG
jgi:hypothetical protein